MPPFEVRLSASLLIVKVYETSPILLVEVLTNISDMRIGILLFCFCLTFF